MNTESTEVAQRGTEKGNGGRFGEKGSGGRGGLGFFGILRLRSE